MAMTTIVINCNNPTPTCDRRGPKKNFSWKKEEICIKKSEIEFFWLSSSKLRINFFIDEMGEMIQSLLCASLANLFLCWYRLTGEGRKMMIKKMMRKENKNVWGKRWENFLFLIIKKFHFLRDLPLKIFHYLVMSWKFIRKNCDTKLLPLKIRKQNFPKTVINFNVTSLHYHENH